MKTTPISVKDKVENVLSRCESVYDTALMKLLPDSVFEKTTFHDTEDEWLDDRDTGFGGSETAGSLGADVIQDDVVYESAFSIYQRKVGASPRLEGIHLDIGHAVEPVINKWFQKTNPDCRTVDLGDYAITRESDSAYVTTDRLIPEAPKLIGHGIGEFKHRNHHVAHLWDDGLPTCVDIQAQMQMACCDAEWGKVCVVLSNTKLVTFHVERNDRLISNLRIHLERLWERVLNNDPPPPDATTAPKILELVHGPQEPESIVYIPETIQTIWSNEDGTPQMLHSVDIDAEIIAITKEVKDLETRKANLRILIENEIIKNNGQFGILRDGGGNQIAQFTVKHYDAKTVQAYDTKAHFKMTRRKLRG